MGMCVAFQAQGQSASLTCIESSRWGGSAFLKWRRPHPKRTSNHIRISQRRMTPDWLSLIPISRPVQTRASHAPLTPFWPLSTRSQLSGRAVPGRSTFAPFHSGRGTCVCMRCLDSASEFCAPALGPYPLLIHPLSNLCRCHPKRDLGSLVTVQTVSFSLSARA
jgi:hypothetical protein